MSKRETLSPGVLYAHLYSQALPYCQSRYGSMLRTVLFEDGHFFQFGDYLNWRAVRNVALGASRDAGQPRFFVYAHEEGEAQVYEFDFATESFNILRPPVVEALGPRSRTSAVAS